MRIAVISSVALLSIVGLAAYKYSRWGYESPPYEVLLSDGPFEIRRYPSLLLASTPMEDPDPAEGSSFMRLFRYISGQNAAQQEIAMTTPVLTTEEGGQRRMSFVIPRDVAESGPPQAPSGQQVEIEAMAGGRFAAYRFSGGWDGEKFDRAKAKLADWMNRQGLATQAEFLIANYDPPFTPSFLRRNEVLARLQSGAEEAAN